MIKLYGILLYKNDLKLSFMYRVFISWIVYVSIYTKHGTSTRYTIHEVFVYLVPNSEANEYTERVYCTSVLLSSDTSLKPTVLV